MYDNISEMLFSLVNYSLVCDATSHFLFFHYNNVHVKTCFGFGSVFWLHNVQLMKSCPYFASVHILAVSSLLKVVPILTVSIF